MEMGVVRTRRMQTAHFYSPLFSQLGGNPIGARKGPKTSAVKRIPRIVGLLRTLFFYLLLSHIGGGVRKTG